MIIGAQSCSEESEVIAKLRSRGKERAQSSESTRPDKKKTAEQSAKRRSIAREKEQRTRNSAQSSAEAPFLEMRTKFGKYTI
jgi:hypothetical protein